MFCSSCGSQLPDAPGSHKYCYKCGKVPQELAQKYEQGKVFTAMCPKCGYENELLSAGVHESASGTLRVYDADEEFECPHCVHVPKQSEELYAAPIQEKCETKSSKTVMSFADYKKAKGKEWNSKLKGHPKGKLSDQQKDNDVVIFISLMEWHKDISCFKTKRGKRLALKIPTSISYLQLKIKAEEKWKNYHINMYDPEEAYVLLYEDGQKALFMPGGKEAFCLKKYREEVGKDYNRITFYLCKQSDYDASLLPEASNVSDQSDDEKLSQPPNKVVRSQASTCILIPDDHEDTEIGSNEELDKGIENKKTYDQTKSIECDHKYEDIASIENMLKNAVNSLDQHFLVVRRGCDFLRLLKLWQREASKSSLDKKLVVKYLGEEGIDSGAMAKEFLSEAIRDMGKIMFPGGSPLNSTLHLQSGNLKACGEIVAVSLAQGGEPPCFLDAGVYALLVEPEVSLKDLNQDYLTPSEKELLDSIKNDATFHSDLIIDHGYTGIIKQENVEQIVKSVAVSLVSRKKVILKEFMEGMKLYGLDNLLVHNPEVCKPLFVQSDVTEVDANYVFAMIQPEYSPAGTTRRKAEETLMDLLQYFLITLEDENIAGYESAITDDDDLIDAGDLPQAKPMEKFEMAEMSPAGVMKWLTGQRHKPISGELLKVTARFDHDCLVQNPLHKICFPRVSKCSREITFPTAHMEKSEDFKHIFLLAFCKGQGFG